MPISPSRTRPVFRSAALVGVVAVAILGAVGCQNARAGARCNPGFAQQGNYVLICRNGRWAKWATKATVAQNLIAAAKSKAAAAEGGADSTGSDAAGFSAPDAVLPDDATCAAAVHPAAEIRARNATANATPGTRQNLTGPYPLFSRVDGNYTGTTDEIIQWAACKWGFDADVLRAQMAVESWWDQNSLSGYQTDPTKCVPGHPIGADGPTHAGQCPAYSGLLSLTYGFYQNGYPQVMASTAYDLDYVLAYWRSCYTGQVGWLNTVDRGGQYGPGDAWGCIGEWASGRWHTASSDSYVAAVQTDLNQRIWTTPSFINS